MDVSPVLLDTPEKIPHKNHVTLDNDIIVGGGLKSSDVYAEGREKCGWKVLKRGPARLWCDEVKSSGTENEIIQILLSILTGTIVTPIDNFVMNA